MNAQQLSGALGKVHDRYVMEAVAYRRKKQTVWLRWGAVAACLCLCVVGAVSAFSLKGGSQDAVPAISMLEFDGCYYEVCDSDRALEKCGLPGKITAELAGEHLAYLEHDGGAGYRVAAGWTDIELCQYAPAPCGGVCVVREGGRYMAALFCNFLRGDGSAAVELSELYRVYGLNGAEAIASVVRTVSRGKSEVAVGGAVTAPEAVAEFYRFTTSLSGFSNGEFQAAVFGGIPEEDQSAAHSAFAEDGVTLRVELKTGLRFYLRFYPGYGWVYGNGTLCYYQMDEAAHSWFGTYMS